MTYSKEQLLRNAATNERSPVAVIVRALGHVRSGSTWKVKRS